MRSRRIPRSISTSLLVMLVTVLAVPATPAGAVSFTSSTVNTPSTGLYPWYDDTLASGNAMTVTGTLNSVGSPADFVCTRTNQGTFDSGTLGTHTGIVFSASPYSYPSSGTSGMLQAITLGGRAPGPCHLRLVPQWFPLTDVNAAPFAGPVINAGSRRRDIDPSGQYGYSIYAGQSAGLAWILPFSSCGLANHVLTSGDSQSDYFFGCNNYIYDGSVSTPAPPSTPYMTVDGKAVYSSSSNPSRSYAGYQPMSESVTHSAADGSVTVIEHAPLFRCAPDATFPAGAGCTSFAPSGILLTRRIQTAADGRRVLFTDSFSSTNGAAHSVSLNTEEDMAGNDVNVQLPGGTFQAYAAPVNVPLAAAGTPGRIQLRYDSGAAPNGSFDAPVAAITMGALPDHALMHSSRVFALHNSFTVPAKGTRELRRVYTTEASLTALAGKSAWELDWVRVPTGVLITGATKRNIRGIKMPVTMKCPITERTCTAVVTARYAGKKVGGGRLAATAGGRTRTATFKLTGKAKARLRAHRSAKLVLTLVGTDGAGNPFTVVRKVTVR